MQLTGAKNTGVRMKKGKRQKVNFSLKHISYYSVFFHLNPFFNQFVVLGLFFIFLVSALEQKIAKQLMLTIFFLHFFFILDLLRNNISIYFHNFV